MANGPSDFAPRAHGLVYRAHGFVYRAHDFAYRAREFAHHISGRERRADGLARRTADFAQYPNDRAPRAGDFSYQADDCDSRSHDVAQTPHDFTLVNGDGGRLAREIAQPDRDVLNHASGEEGQAHGFVLSADGSARSTDGLRPRSSRFGGDAGAEPPHVLRDQLWRKRSAIDPEIDVTPCPGYPMHRERMGADHKEPGLCAYQRGDEIEKIRIHPRVSRPRSGAPGANARTEIGRVARV